MAHRPSRRHANAGRRFPAEILTPDEVRALIKACSNRAPTGVRNRALLVLLYRGGLRVAEALRLRPKDLDRAAGTVTILVGTGGKRRTIGRAPLICTLHGKPVASAYVRALMPRLAQRAGIEKRVHAHGLRHTHAAELALEGKAMNLIQAQLGHSSLATTSRYLAHIAPAELVKAMQARTWPVSLAATSRSYGLFSSRWRAARAVPSSCAASAIWSIFSQRGRASPVRPAASRAAAS